MEENKYQSRWESRGSVRTRPRKVIDFSKSGYFFPEDKQPLLLNKRVQGLGEEVKERILLESFYKYLHDIVNLEIKLITSACDKIIYGDLVVDYTDIMKLNAYTIIIDEYYHVYIAKDMIFQLDGHFNLGKVEYPVSDAYKAVAEIKGRLDVKYHDIFEIVAVCIFETTLVRELVEFFNSENVHPSIKYYVNDHMNDEGRHYGYFYELLCYTWEKVPEDYREAIGTEFGDFVKLYLNIESEKEFNGKLFGSILGDIKDSKKIVDDLYRGFEINPDIPIVKNVINVLKASGLLSDEHIKGSFKKMDWEF